MSTIEDFENAPVGATATSRDGRKVCRRETRTPAGLDWVREEDGSSIWADADDLSYFGYTLDHEPAHAPTTAQEALDLAWDLAHPLKEGQHIPEGTRLIDRSYRNDLSAYTTLADITINAREALTIRSQDPLPAPEPDWLDAPAVLASVKDEDGSLDRQIFARLPGGRWAGRYGNWETYETWELTDVTPLYPEGKKE